MVLLAPPEIPEMQGVEDRAALEVLEAQVLLPVLPEALELPAEALPEIPETPGLLVHHPPGFPEHSRVVMAALAALAAMLVVPEARAARGMAVWGVLLAPT